MKDAGNNDPRKEMWQVRDRLNCFFPKFRANLVQQDCKNDRHDKGCNQIKYAHSQRVPDYLQKCCI